MRAAPDVIQIGEIRDRESMQAALDMAGTGHLVLGTLHANNSAETLDRIINMFPQEQHGQVFMDLAHYLRAIMSQRLVRSRVPASSSAAVELLLNTPHIKDLMLKGDISAVKDAHKRQRRAGHADLRRCVTASSTRPVRLRSTRRCRMPTHVPISKRKSISVDKSQASTAKVLTFMARCAALYFR